MNTNVLDTVKAFEESARKHTGTAAFEGGYMSLYGPVHFDADRNTNIPPDGARTQSEAAA